MTDWGREMHVRPYVANELPAVDATRRLKGRLRDQRTSINFPNHLSGAPHLAAEAPFFRFSIDMALTVPIGAFARSQDVTVYSILLVGLGLALSRFSRQDQITIAAPLLAMRAYAMREWPAAPSP